MARCTPSALEREVEEEFVRSFERQFSTPLLGSDEAHSASAAADAAEGAERRGLSEFLGLPEVELL